MLQNAVGLGKQKNMSNQVKPTDSSSWWKSVTASRNGCHAADVMALPSSEVKNGHLHKARGSNEQLPKQFHAVSTSESYAAYAAARLAFALPRHCLCIAYAFYA